ncbi:MAG: hypothetical protein ACRDL7_01085, partial [Gaiellaceae bacterium]
MKLSTGAERYGCSTATIRDAEFGDRFLPVQAVTVGKRHVSKMRNSLKNEESLTRSGGFPWIQERKVGPKKQGLPVRGYPQKCGKTGVNQKKKSKSIHTNEPNDLTIVNLAVKEVILQEEFIKACKLQKVELWLSSLRYEHASTATKDLFEAMEERKALLRSLHVTCDRLEDNRKSINTFYRMNKRISELYRFGGRVPSSSSQCRNLDYDLRDNRATQVNERKLYRSNGFLTEENGLFKINSRYVMDQSGNKKKTLWKEYKNRNKDQEERIQRVTSDHVAQGEEFNDISTRDRKLKIKQLRQQLAKLEDEDRNTMGQLKDDDDSKYNSNEHKPIIISGHSTRKVERVYMVTLNNSDTTSPAAVTYDNQSLSAENTGRTGNLSEPRPPVGSLFERTFIRMLTPLTRIPQMDLSFGIENGGDFSAGNADDVTTEAPPAQRSETARRVPHPLEVTREQQPTSSAPLLSPTDTITSAIEAFKALERLSPGRDIRELFDEYVRTGGIAETSRISDFDRTNNSAPTTRVHFSERNDVQSYVSDAGDLVKDDDGSSSSDDDSDAASQLIRFLREANLGKSKKRSKEERLSRKAAKLTKKLLDAASRLKVKVLKKEDIPLQRRMKFQAFTNSIIPVLRTDQRTSAILTNRTVNHDVEEAAKLAFHSLLHTYVEDHYRTYLQRHPEDGCKAFDELRKHCA